MTDEDDDVRSYRGCMIGMLVSVMFWVAFAIGVLWGFVW